MRAGTKAPKKGKSEKQSSFCCFALDENLSRISCCEHIKDGGATHHTTIIISKNTQSEREGEKDGRKMMDE